MFQITVDQNQLQKIIEDAVQKALGSQPGHEPRKIEIIDQDELCKRLSLTRQTVSRWREKGKIPFIQIGSAFRYDWIKVIEALESKKKEAGRRS